MKRASEILPAIITPGMKLLSPIQARLEAAEREVREAPVQLYQHTIFCQTSLPYRDPGDAREWERTNGRVSLKIKAGEALHPTERRWVPVGLPFGPKCRLVLMHLNQRALLTQNPRIEVEDSLTAFVRHVLKLDPKGRNIRSIKQQLGRLAASDIALGAGWETAATSNGTTSQVHIVRDFNIWCPKDERQRILWPSTIDLSLDYFASLLSFAVPLVMEHVAALSHSCMALDIYAWLAQRLHRIPADEPARVSWRALHDQFGQGYSRDRIDKFRQVFRVALAQVLRLYRDAKVEDEEPQRPNLIIQGDCSVWREPQAKGLMLYHSKPPVPRRIFPVG